MDDQYIRRFIPGDETDGDTLTTDFIDHGMHIASHSHIVYRLYGIDTPEKTGPTRSAGLAAKAFTEAWVNEHLHGGKWLLARTIQVTKKDGTRTLQDSFGRYIAVIYCMQDGEELNTTLLREKIAVPFMDK